MLRLEKARSFVIGWLIFAMTLFAIFGFRSFQPFRNLLPLVPGLCIGASVAIFASRDFFAANRLHWITTPPPLSVIIGLLLLSLLIPSYRGIRERLTRGDTRIQAIDWIKNHTVPGDRVLALSELRFLPSEWSRVTADVQVASLPAAAQMLKRQEFDYVISSKFQAGPTVAPQVLAQQTQWQDLTNAFSLKAAFGQINPPLEPYFWRTNYELILVLARPSQTVK